MKKLDKKFIEEQLKDNSDDFMMKHYRASWFESANFKCPKHHTFRFAWDCCYLPMESLWPTAACQQCQKAKDLLKDAARQREDFLKKRLRCQNKADQEREQKRRDEICDRNFEMLAKGWKTRAKRESSASCSFEKDIEALQKDFP
jgi:hypothetical protein